MNYKERERRVNNSNLSLKQNIFRFYFVDTTIQVQYNKINNQILYRFTCVHYYRAVGLSVQSKIWKYLIKKEEEI